METIWLVLDGTNYPIDAYTSVRHAFAKCDELNSYNSTVGSKKISLCRVVEIKVKKRARRLVRD